MSAYRKMLINLLGEKCELCNSSVDLRLHHKDGNRKNNDIRNIQLLCRDCHYKVHGKKKKRGKCTVDFTDEQWRIIDGLRGVFGNKDSEIVKYIVMSYLSEKGFVKREMENKFTSGTVNSRARK